MVHGGAAGHTHGGGCAHFRNETRRGGEAAGGGRAGLAVGGRVALLLCRCLLCFFPTSSFFFVVASSFCESIGWCTNVVTMCSLYVLRVDGEVRNLVFFFFCSFLSCPSLLLSRTQRTHAKRTRANAQVGQQHTTHWRTSYRTYARLCVHLRVFSFCFVWVCVGGETGSSVLLGTHVGMRECPSENHWHLKPHDSGHDTTIASGVWCGMN